jgi:hypothetical protein
VPRADVGDGALKVGGELRLVARHGLAGALQRRLEPSRRLAGRRRQLQRHDVGPRRSLRQAELLEHEALREVGQQQVGIEPDRLVELGQGAFEVAGHAQGERGLQPDIGVPGVELGGPAQADERAGGVAALQQAFRLRDQIACAVVR